MQRNTKKKVVIISIVAVVVVLVGVISCSFMFGSETSLDLDEVSSENTVYSDDSMYYQEVSPESIVYDEELETYYVNNQILITANEGVSKSKIEELVSEYDGKIVGYIEITNDYQIELSGKLTLEALDEIVEALLDNENIEFAYINKIFEISADYIPDDSKYDNDDWDESSPDGLNWGLEVIDVMGAWDYLDEMQTVKVGVIDSCFDDSHEDLDDVFVEIVNNSTNMSLDDSHGTHVSGIIAAEFDNDTGISGVAPEAELYGASLYNSFYDDSNNQISFTTLMTMKYCLTSLITAGCKVINVSMSCDFDLETQYDVFGSFLSKLIASNYDFVIVQAAGNDDTDAYNTGLFVGIENEEVQDKIIVVGSMYVSTTNNYNFSSFSNYGNFVDVVAPGEDIYSTIIDNSYGYKSGTSMAAPYVSGIAALCYSVNPDLTGDQIKDIIVNSYSTTVEATVSSSKSYTYPLVNAKTAVVTALSMQVGEEITLKDSNEIANNLEMLTLFNSFSDDEDTEIYQYDYTGDSELDYLVHCFAPGEELKLLFYSEDSGEKTINVCDISLGNNIAKVYWSETQETFVIIDSKSSVASGYQYYYIYDKTGITNIAEREYSYSSELEASVYNYKLSGEEVSENTFDEYINNLNLVDLTNGILLSSFTENNSQISSDNFDGVVSLLSNTDIFDYYESIDLNHDGVLDYLLYTSDTPQSIYNIGYSNGYTIEKSYTSQNFFQLDTKKFIIIIGK